MKKLPRKNLNQERGSEMDFLLRETIFKTLEVYEGQQLTKESIKVVTLALENQLAVRQIDVPTISAGDTVTLKSGGPKMTVCEILDGADSSTKPEFTVVRCVYFPVEAHPTGTYQISPDQRDYAAEAQILEVQLCALTKVE